MFRPDVTVGCDEPVPGLGNATAIDNCDNDVTVEYLGQWIMGATCSNSYQIMRTWLAEDNCANSTTKAQIITVQDIVPPTFTYVPPSITLECTDPIPVL